MYRVKNIREKLVENSSKLRSALNASTPKTPVGGRKMNQIVGFHHKDNIESRLSFRIMLQAAHPSIR